MQAWKLSRDCYALARREESAMEPDFLDMLTALNAAAVKYLLVGAHALAWHGRPRATGDLDIWIEASPENAQRVMQALEAFGAPLVDIQAADFAQAGMFYRFGQPPLRIEILTTLSGLSFEEAWRHREHGNFGPVPIEVIGLADFIRNKRASGRPQDLVDADSLER